MINNVIITKATFEDLHEILTLQKEAFLSEAILYNDYTFDAMVQTYDSIQDDFKEYTFLKAVYNGNIIGSVKGRVTTDGMCCWIGRLMVKPQFQNHGIARRLMSAIEAEFPNTTQYLLFTGSKSIKNIGLYKSCGYSIIEEYADKKKPDLILVKMVKTIHFF